MAAPRLDPDIPTNVADLIKSDLWRSVHLAAPPLRETHDPLHRIALVDNVVGNTNELHDQYTRFVRLVQQLCAEATRLLRDETHTIEGISIDDRGWLSARLEALSGRFQAWIPSADQHRRERAMQVAIERVGARLRLDVEKRHSNRDVRGVAEFIHSTLNLFLGELHDGCVDEDFLWHEVVSLLYIDIDTRAWCRYCRDSRDKKRWEDLYVKDVRNNLNDMRSDLGRIRTRRGELARRMAAPAQHSLAKSEFVPVGRGNGRAF